MTLPEAIRSGKRFTRESLGTEVYYTYSEMAEEVGIEAEDVLATDYVVEPDETITIPISKFAEAWESARAGTLKVKPAGQTDFYHRLVNKLKEY
jgi:hypothetical protein